MVENRMIVDIINGIELLVKINNKEIDEKNYLYIISKGKYKEFAIYFEKNIPCINIFGIMKHLDVADIIDMEINIVIKQKEEEAEEEEKEEEEIDIQAIDEITKGTLLNGDFKIDLDEIADILNKITKAIKQLDKRISNLQNNDNTLERDFAKLFPSTVLLKSNVPSEIEKHIPMM